MKPYLKAIYNKIKFGYIKLLYCSNIKVNGIQLFNYNMKVKIKRTSSLVLGDRIISDGRCTIIIDDKASLKIGKGTYFNEGVMLSAKSTIDIGEECQFGPGVKVFDNDHCFDNTGVKHTHKSNPIRIGNKCWIGANVVILRGTTIEDNCVIGAGCIVKGTIPKGSVVTQSRDLIIRRVSD